MGSPSESNLKAIDASVGGLVWVRRRNGSWWPGRIMGVDELSESCLVSPRSGTPVKLLGREDASVDWYNLEKSKRVKAFRCGEYDKCIEKAKASLANSSKKAVKYARREDAILHALELESAHLNKDSPDFCSGMDKSDGEQNGLGESPTLSHPCEETEQLIAGSSSSEDNSNSAQELSQSGVSFEEPNQISASKEHSVQGRRRKTPNDSEDEGIEGTKRMRGLEDLGMSVVSSLKRKRSHVASIHEFLKRKYRRRPLTKVLESTAMVSVPVLCEQLASPTGSPFPGVSDSKVSGLESNELKRCFSMVINNKSDSNGVSCENGTSLEGSEHGIDITCIKQKENENSSISGLHEDYSDRLFDVPFVWEERHCAGFSPIFESCSSQKLQVGAGGSRSSRVETLSLGNEEFKESGSTSSGAAAENISISPRIEQSSSKWRLKGKRNSRLKTKNRKRNSRKHVDGEFNGCFTETQANDFPCGSRHISDKQLYSPIPQRSRPFRQSRFRLNPKYQMQDFSLRNYGANSFLYDVNLEVKASYRPQHVPYVSLMSKLNGQAITGHPLTIEVLDDGFCDLMGSPNFYVSSSSCGHDDELEENKSEGVDMDYEMKPNHGGGRFFTKSQPKRKNGLLTKKIRKLSSLTASHKRSKEEKKPVVEKPRGPAVACVPLKVVFSRINAALYTSMRPAHCIVALSNS